MFHVTTLTPPGSECSPTGEVRHLRLERVDSLPRRLELRLRRRQFVPRRFQFLLCRFQFRLCRFQFCLCRFEFRSRGFERSLGVAVQVAFESKGLKPGFHLIGSRFETRRFQDAIGHNWIQLVQPPPGSHAALRSRRQLSPSLIGRRRGRRWTKGRSLQRRRLIGRSSWRQTRQPPR
jgi:hypothetical protein